MSAVRFAVLGTGRLGSVHARLLGTIDGVRLVGVHDASPARAAAVAEACGTVAFADPARLLREADAVVVAVSTSAHHAVAAAAISAGRHVLVEKPLAPSLEEADDLVERAAARGVLLCVGHVERFNPAIRACRPHLADPRFVTCQRLAPFQQRGTDVPVMLDLMIHDIDLVLDLVDSAVESVQAIGVPVFTDTIDLANARITFRNGAVADISASRASADRTRHLRLFQPTGYFSLDLAAGRGVYLRRRPGEGPAGTIVPPAGLADLVETIPLAGPPGEPLRLELEAFRDAILGRPGGTATAGEGRAALEVALRIQRDIERGSHVAAGHP
ncbi:MAG: Gfo/Idh/MocA family oxidoreductase [Gemmatimonadota bacterium]|nr:Gfo/Idh/MocA family oxidoreductase [Gemmatimonadota bacterium]